MDMGTARGLVTLALFISFIAIAVWAYSSRRKKDFDEAARLPLDDEPPGSAGDVTKKSGGVSQ
jgi:cytochrome c oxidase cbb3-type subunit 4